MEISHLQFIKRDIFVSKSAQFLTQNLGFQVMDISSIENTIVLTYTSMHYPSRNVEVTSTLNAIKPRKKIYKIVNKL